jgi:hypothetical protein
MLGLLLLRALQLQCGLFDVHCCVAATAGLSRTIKQHETHRTTNTCGTLSHTAPGEKRCLVHHTILLGSTRTGSTNTSDNL